MSKEWQPPEWEEIKVGFCNTMGCCSHNCSHDCSKLKYLEVVASAMLKALIKWLFEPCPHCEPFDPLRDMSPVLRKDCPQCMEQLKESE